MMSLPSRLKIQGLLSIGMVCLLVSCGTTTKRELPRANPADVESITAIVRASYEVLCGPQGVPRDWARDRTLYLPSATFVSVYEEGGAIKRKIQTPEEYRRNFEIGEGVFETEIGRRIERFGDVAQVRSVAVYRERPDGPVLARFVNYFHLYWDGDRWWITGMVWDTERPGVGIPEAWINTSAENEELR